MKLFEYLTAKLGRLNTMCALPYFILAKNQRIEVMRIIKDVLVTT